MGCNGRSFAVEGSRKGKPLKNRDANFSRKKRGSTFGLFWLWEETGYVWDVVAGPRKGRKGKPMKTRVANFSKKGGSTFGLFWLWEETGYVWDVVAGVLL